MRRNGIDPTAICHLCLRFKKAISMTNKPVTTDQQLDISRFSNIGQYLVQSKDVVIAKWEKQIRHELKGAKYLDQPILVDTLPAFIDNIAEALTPDYPREFACDFSTVAQEHGGERARMTVYNPDEIIREYQVLKEVLLEVLGAKFSLTREQYLIVIHSIDFALRESVTAFALVQTEIREKFIATLTHDLRNPLGVIKTAAELVSDDYENEVQGREFLAMIVDNAKRIDRMIQDLLDATVVKSGGKLQLVLDKCDVLEIASCVTRDLAMTHGDRFKIAGPSVEGYWSADGLRRAIENLCLNAIKYGDATSPVSIQIACSYGRTVVSVHNEGPPIPVEEQEAIFQVFRRAYSAKRDKKMGWGLGLALVRGVAEGHGGSVMVDSKEGRGTTFMMDIPQDARPFQERNLSR